MEARFLLLVSHDASNSTVGDFLRSVRLPVIGEDVPLDRSEAELTGDAKDDGTARSVGCAEVADRSAERVFEDGVAVGELLADAGRGLPGEPGVGHGVVADEMSGRGDGAGDLRALTNVAADEEEAGADVEAGRGRQEGAR